MSLHLPLPLIKLAESLKLRTVTEDGKQDPPLLGLICYTDPVSRGDICPGADLLVRNSQEVGMYNAMEMDGVKTIGCN